MLEPNLTEINLNSKGKDSIFNDFNILAWILKSKIKFYYKNFCAHFSSENWLNFFLMT